MVTGVTEQSVSVLSGHLKLALSGNQETETDPLHLFRPQLRESIWMDQNYLERQRDPGGGASPTADWESSESLALQKEQRKCSSCTASDDLSTSGNWCQSSICRSWQRAELLLRSTLNPGLRWLFHDQSQDEEEENFIAAHNLVSRSSARLQRLQHSLMTVAVQWQLVGGPQAGPLQACVKTPPDEGAVVLLPASSSLQGHYRALWKLLEQRSLLLLIHEYTRRLHLAAAYLSRVAHLLELQTNEAHHPHRQNQSSCSSFWVGLSSLSQELRVHLNHWFCLRVRVRSDPYLRRAVAQNSGLLQKMKRTLDLLSLQVLVLTERYVYAVLSAVGRVGPDCIPREVLEDVVAGAELYNQAVEEQHGSPHWREAVLKGAEYSRPSPVLSETYRCHPRPVSIKDLITVLATHHAQATANQLLHCTPPSLMACMDDSAHPVDRSSCGRTKWTWEQMQDTDLIVDNKNCPVPHTHLDPAVLKHHPSRPSNSSWCQPYPSQSDPSQTSSSLHCSAPPLSRLFQVNSSSAEPLLQVLVSSGDLLVPLVPHRSAEPAEHQLPVPAADSLSPGALLINTSHSEVGGVRGSVNRCQNMDGHQPDRTKLDLTAGPDVPDSSGPQQNDDKQEEPMVVPDSVRWPPSVQWLDLGRPLVLADLLGRYHALLCSLCSKAFWLNLHVPPTGSINLKDDHSSFQILDRISRASETGLLPQESRRMLKEISLHLFVLSAHATWDQVMCRALSSSLKDKCLRSERVDHVTSTSEQGDGIVTSLTMRKFLLLPQSLLSSLSRHSDGPTPGALGLQPSNCSLQRRSVSLLLASVQMSSVWVVSKALQFLSSWNLQKFLLITQGDLRVWKESLHLTVHQTRSLVMNSDSDHHSTVWNHHHLLMGQQLDALDEAVSDLQSFSALLLKTFSTDCKRMSGEIFERSMPSAVHWRPSNSSGFPSSPSAYVSGAAQSVIGQVLDGVAPLPDDARVQALSITMTAFMEAWMEHILKKKIKFSLQGALQLKQDFDSVREMIHSDRSGLSDDLHQRLLGLRVFQQVDSAIMCLLQQPQNQRCRRCRHQTWEPFSRCCPANRNRDSVDSGGGATITNLGCMEAEDPALTDPPVVTADLPSSPADPYLAPSAALGSAQQDWLDLRIQSGGTRWRLLGLQCLCRTEP